MRSNQFTFSTSVIAWPLFFILAMWVVFWFELKFSLNLKEYGIYPRSFEGLRGVLFSPFIHGDLLHLYNNSIPLLLLLAALRYFYRSVSFKVLIFGVLISGILTWLIGRESYHIGASGLIYVLVSFIFFKGIQTKYYRLVALSLTLIMVYGGLIWYVFPDVKEGISWEGHLSGLITGFGMSLFFKTPEYKQPIRYEWERPDFDPQLDPFMKHFDENGNFVNTPKPEEEIPNYFTTSIQVIYDFIGINKKNPS
jgi:membrane associated rhomboid family serine protease